MVAKPSFFLRFHQPNCYWGTKPKKASLLPKQILMKGTKNGNWVFFGVAVNKMQQLIVSKTT
jgi:hypothetical protein